MARARTAASSRTSPPPARRSPPRRPGSRAPRCRGRLRAAARATRCCKAPRWRPRRRPAPRALLLSAAKATDGASARRRCGGRSTRSAKPIDGRADVRAGLRHVQRPGRVAAAAPGRRDPVVRLDAPVCTPLSEQLPSERCESCRTRAGHRRLQPLRRRRGRPQGRREQDATRSSSPAPAARPAPIKHESRWAATTAPSARRRSVALPLNKTVTITVTAKPATEGAHGAIMRIDDPATSVRRLRGVHRGGGLERRHEAHVLVHRDGLGRAQRLHVVLRHRAGGRQAPCR